jgi:hypothetical protein
MNMMTWRGVLFGVGSNGRLGLTSERRFTHADNEPQARSTELLSTFYRSLCRPSWCNWLL